ncbi:MAG: DUF3568 domain-containing protein [Candidatus Magnetoovum sp. WYHC-5]|nr:DUF3568 domain-containing protein [Candidatus Magnetoovum sp. WYHC-5]
MIKTSGRCAYTTKYYNSIAISICLTIILLIGCVRNVKTAGEGTYSFVDGTLRYNIEASVAQTYNAALKALKQLELPVFEKNSDALVAYVKSTFVDGKDIKINIQYLTKEITVLSIHIGIFGDENRSMRVLEQIELNI